MTETTDEPGPRETAGLPLPQHPLVARRKPDPAATVRRVTTLVGLPGDSDRAGWQRLYLTMAFDYFAEFRVADIVHSELVPTARSPFPGHDATSVEVARDAVVHYTWARSTQPVDQFDLDVRLGRGSQSQPSLRAAAQRPPQTVFCGTELCGTVEVGTDFCPTDLCQTDDTCLPGNCQTLPTDIDCPTGNGQTCVNTCADTCVTCQQTQCLPTCVPTCAITCQCGTQHTCVALCVPLTRQGQCQVRGAE